MHFTLLSVVGQWLLRRGLSGSIVVNANNIWAASTLVAAIGIGMVGGIVHLSIRQGKLIQCVEDLDKRLERMERVFWYRKD